jgi:hypothetical protein
VIGPGVSAILAHNAPKEILIPIFNKSNCANNKLGSTTPKVIRSPSPKCGLKTKLLIVFEVLYTVLIDIILSEISERLFPKIQEKIMRD